MFYGLKSGHARVNLYISSHTDYRVRLVFISGLTFKKSSGTMWRVRYNANENSESSFFSLCEVAADGDKNYYQTTNQSTTVDRVPLEMNGVNNTHDLPQSASIPSINGNLLPWVKADSEDQFGLPRGVNKSPVSNGDLPSSSFPTIDSNLSTDDFIVIPNQNYLVAEQQVPLHSRPSSIRKQVSTQNEPVLPIKMSPHHEDDDASSLNNKNNDKKKSLLYGNQKQILWAVLVRLLLIGHNVLTVWRVVEACNEPYYWLITVANLLLLLELHVVIVHRAGVDYSW